jgi:hypothetical protein
VAATNLNLEPVAPTPSYSAARQGPHQPPNGLGVPDPDASQGPNGPLGPLVERSIQQKLHFKLRSSVGDTILFSCLGIAIECQGRHITKFLTSASLVRALNGTNKDHDDLKVGAYNDLFLFVYF